MRRPSRSLSTFSVLLFITLAIWAWPARGYELNDDGTAEIGAYHVQPGRCASAERSLGPTRYGLFFGASPFHTTFGSDDFSTSSYSSSSISDSLDDVSESSDSIGSDASAHSSTDDKTSHRYSSISTLSSASKSWDATQQCAFNPTLTEGYGGLFAHLQTYLVYSRCIYGTNDMRVICGTTDEQGRPTHQYYSLVQATCPRGTRCKNLCATIKRPELTSRWASGQVQLAQCLEDTKWQQLTEMYRPKAVQGRRVEVIGLQGTSKSVDKGSGLSNGDREGRSAKLAARKKNEADAQRANVEAKSVRASSRVDSSAPVSTDAQEKGAHNIGVAKGADQVVHVASAGGGTETPLALVKPSTGKLPADHAFEKLQKSPTHMGFRRRDLGQDGARYHRQAFGHP